MQFPVYGDMISVKNLKECLNQLDDNDRLLSDKLGSLLICKLEKFDNGNLKDVKIERVINFFYEEIISLERCKQMNKRDDYDGN